MKLHLSQATPDLPDPRCAACGHDLKGATTSAVCPECGRPLVEVLVRGPLRYAMGRRYVSRARVGSLPLLAYAIGPGSDGKPGHARGFIAIGDKATGVIAIGGLARGVVAIGGLSVGICTFGGASIGTLSALGGLAIAPLGSSIGGLSIGGLAQGGLAVGIVAQGGLAIGWAARGGEAIGKYAWSLASKAQTSEETLALFRNQLEVLVGPPGVNSLFHGVVWTLAIMFAALLLCAIYGMSRYRRDPADPLQADTPNPFSNAGGM